MKLIIKCIDNVKYELPINGGYTLEGLMKYGYECINENNPYVYNEYDDDVVIKTIVINSKHIISVEVEAE